MQSISASPRLCVENNRLAGLILAGGEGTRFGCPKAWARLPDGRSFLDACAGAMLAAGASPVVATLPPGSDRPAIDGLAAAALPGPGLDMYGSLRVGLARLVTEAGWSRVAVLPVDHPLVLASSIATVAAVDASAAIPSFNGKHGHPVVLDRPVAEGIAAGTYAGPTLREVLRLVRAVDVEVDDPGTVANCNTPEALATALRSRP
jgi:CTP:molybdopterin cytidylyltransferase MocA